MTEVKQGVVWDLTSFFPEFGGEEMVAFKAKLAEDVKGLQARGEELGPLSRENMDGWEEVLLDAEQFLTRASHIASYVGCLAAADARNEAYAQERAALSRFFAEFAKFDVDLTRAMKEVPDDLMDEFCSRSTLQTAAYSIRRTREQAQYMMSVDQEKLTTDLGVDGIQAWGRLYNSLTGKLEFTWTKPDGTTEKTPISQWRALMSDPDRELGRAAFKGGNKAWEGIEDICAASLNAIAGTRLTLDGYRGVDHFLDRSMFQAAIEKETLDGMYEAIWENIEIAREIFRAKSRALGREGIWFFERESPLPLSESARIPWQQGVELVNSSFGSVYPKLRDYYGSMLEKHWIESEVRPGKAPGAFCTGSLLTREQRVYMTFNGTLGEVRTMAHEVGHAFHGHVLRQERPFASQYPMTLAETASIFAEHIFAEGIYADPEIDDEGKLKMLDADLTSAAVMLLDITVRFEFEKAFHEERAKGEVSISRLKELMTETQRRVFGDVLEEGGEDPLFWASKLHFYITGVSFYNYPYTFGFLLARSLHGLMKEEGPSFLPKYEQFLRITGNETVENVAKQSLGVDVSDPAFWAAAIKSLEGPLALYRELIEKRS